MTQAKSNGGNVKVTKIDNVKNIGQNNPKVIERQKTMNEKFRALPRSEQEAITNFFNLHNAAIWIYNFLIPEAKEYVDFCISMVNEANKLEQEDGALQH